MHISSNSVISTSLSKIRLIDVSENRAAVPAEEKQQLKQQQHQTMIFLFLLNVFDYPLTYLLWQFWFAISQFLVHNKNILVQREDVLLLSFFKERSLVVVSLS